MYKGFRVFCTHPSGCPLSAFDTRALDNGFLLIINATDEKALRSRAEVAVLVRRYPGKIFIRCGNTEALGYIHRGFNIITDPGGPAPPRPEGSGTADIIAESLDPQQVRAASKQGYSGILIRGNEAGGIAGELNNFVFLQAAAELTDLPVYVEGGIGIYALGGLFAAGAAGAVLNEQTFLFIESPLSEEARAFLLNLKQDEIHSVAKNGYSVRFHRKVHSPRADALTEFIDTEDPGPDRMREHIEQESTSYLKDAGSDTKLLLLGADAAFAYRFMNRYACFAGLSEGITKHLESVCSGLCRELPFSGNSRFARSHGIQYPFFQGPMANITESAEFADRVAEAGAMPFIAVGTLPDKASKEIIDTYRKTSERNVLGIGLMGMLGIMDCDGFTQTETVLDFSPDYVILGGGEIEYAERLEQAGVTVYFHTPVRQLFERAVSRGITHVILEGSEAGGHISPFTSLVLWQDILDVLKDERYTQKKLSIVFAGGISSSTGVRFLSGMAAPFTGSGIEFGVQAGTVFLTAREIVGTGALDPEYMERILKGNRTTIVAERIGRPQRMLPSPKTEYIDEWEHRGVQEGRSRADMKREFEDFVNRGALRMASRREVYNPDSATDDSEPVFKPCGDRKRYIEEAGFACGQNICIFKHSETCRSIVEELFTDSKKGLKHFLEPFEGTAVYSSGNDYSGDIAVVGIGSRFPEARNTREYWDNILQGKNCIREVPPERWDPRFYWDPDRNAPNKTYSKIGGFTDYSDFNAAEFGILPKAANNIPGVQRLALLCVKEAAEQAGFDDWGIPSDRIGVFMGTSVCAGRIAEYSLQVEKDRIIDTLSRAGVFGNGEKEAVLNDISAVLHDPEDAINEDSNPEILSNIVAGRIANAFNFTGPNYTADAACASSPAALMNAVRALQSGQVDAAFAGGSDVSNDPLTYVSFAKVGALSARMSCPFDERADGFVMGEGAGVLILKRIEDAERDGDRIYAVIKGIGSSSDGSAKGITAPNPEGQEKALRNAYMEARVCPETIGLYEAHGTSTPAGDAAEFGAASGFFIKHTSARQAIPIGSVKSQIGHAKAAAGIAGIIKCILSLHHRVLPPTINVKHVNPDFNISESPFTINTACSEWTEGALPRRAACSSMGFGGTNFHVVLEEYTRNPEYTHDNSIDNSGVFVMDTSDETSIEKTAGAEIREIEKRNNIISYTAQSLLAAEPLNSYAVPFKNKKDLLKKLSKVGNSYSLRKSLPIIPSPPAGDGEGEGASMHSVSDSSSRTQKPVDNKNHKICFLFPGQGAQFPGMGLEMTRMFPGLEDMVRKADDISESELGVPISDIIAGTSGLEGRPGDILKDTLFCQPAVYLVSCMCGAALGELGIEPDVCMGHSLGEFSALACSGVISFEQGFETVIARAQSIMSVADGDTGAMAALFTDYTTAEDITAQTEGYAVVANKNSPGQNVISGSSRGVKNAAALCRERGIKAVELKVSHGFHSDMVKDAAARFREHVDTLDLAHGRCPVISNVDAVVYPDAEKNPEWYVENLARHIISPVCFTEQVHRAQEEGCGVFITAGPGRILSGLVKDITDKQAVCIDMLTRSDTIYGSIADCINTGIPVNFIKAARAVKAWSRPIQDFSGISPPEEAAPFDNTDNAKIVTYSNAPREHITNAEHGIKSHTPEKGETIMDAAHKKDISDIEEFILAMNDPVLTNMLHSPEFRRFLNNEKTGIRMLTRQTLLDMFSMSAGTHVPQKDRISLPALPPEPALHQVQAKKETEKAGQEFSEHGSEQPYDLSKFRKKLDPEPPVPERIPAAHTRMAASVPVDDGEPAEQEEENRDTDVRAILLEVITEKTGYTEEMIDPDAEFESELRIDSIKQTEIIGMFSERAGIPSEASRNMELEKVTLNTILEQVDRLMQEER